MNLSLDATLAAGYRSASQQARVVTEAWAANHLACPNCLLHPPLAPLPNNAPVADLACPHCAAQFELKAKTSVLGATLPDGAYHTMLARITSATNPHLLVMRYDAAPGWRVRDVLAIPNFLFVPDLIQARAPLGPTARRAGWQGCTILLGQVPEAGRIWLLQNRQGVLPTTVRANWEQARALFTAADALALSAKGWRLALLRCLDKLPLVFGLAEVYAFEAELAARFPQNRHIRPKLRQQLQALRDAGYLRFRGGGQYERVTEK